MPKFNVYVTKEESYVLEVEANTANEAEEIYWDLDELGKVIDGSTRFNVDEIHDANGEYVTDWDKDYSVEVQNA